MAEKIVQYVTYALLGIDGLIVIWFFLLVLSFFADPYGGTQGQILKELRKQNDPDFEKKEGEEAMKTLKTMGYTLLYGGAFIGCSFLIIFGMYWLLDKFKGGQG